MGEIVPFPPAPEFLQEQALRGRSTVTPETDNDESLGDLTDLQVVKKSLAVIEEYRTLKDPSAKRDGEDMAAFLQKLYGTLPL